MLDSEWLDHINRGNFRKGLIPKPKAKTMMDKPFLAEDQYGETEEPKRDMVRERPLQAVRPARDRVRA
jgi:hypothetical protein